jgi:glycosyltransferase involved in cell wall biosynthesis
LKIGVYHPSLYNFGGGEFVALVVVNSLAKNGYDVELLTSKKIKQDQVKKMMGEQIASSVKMIFQPSYTHPGGSFDLFPTVFHSRALKSRCDILVDTYSNCVFPWTDVCYIHFPFLNRFNYSKVFPYLKDKHVRHLSGLPYLLYARKIQDYKNKLIIANSQFTANSIKEFIDVDVKVIYPPVASNSFKQSSFNRRDSPKEDLVVTVSRFSEDKKLETIPYIAKQTEKEVRFVIIGLLHDRKVYEALIRSVKKLGLTEKVKIMPNAPKKELEDVLRRAKIYLHTTFEEHFGISIVEAMASGCVPITHNSGGMIEFVPDQYRYENLRDAAIKINSAIHEWGVEVAEDMVRIAQEFSEYNFSKNFMETFSSYVEQRGKNPY